MNLAVKIGIGLGAGLVIGVGAYYAYKRIKATQLKKELQQSIKSFQEAYLKVPEVQVAAVNTKASRFQSAAVLNAGAPPTIQAETITITPP